MSHDPRILPETPDVQANASDIQAILGSGFTPLRHGAYRLYQVTDPHAARRWLRDVVDSGLVKSVRQLGRDDRSLDGPQRHDEIAMLAFSHEGLARLGLVASEEFPFPAPFVRGPRTSRAGGQWPFGVHVLLAHYQDRAGPGHALLRPEPASGLSLSNEVLTCPSYIGPGGRSTEPFGFRDGIAQPRIDGLRRPGPESLGPLAGDHLVAPGEFILGHRNEYGELAYCPDVVGWNARAGRRFAMNGSYLAVQQIVQHVQRFRDFEAAQPQVRAGEPTLTEKMVGRHKDGKPLVACPIAHTHTGDDPAHDHFRYRVEDFDGLQCPRGAHVRRANPRDMLGWDVESGIATAKLHRLLRRGRVYAGHANASDLPTPAGDPGPAEGLFFMALNADLERQFELVESRWLVNRRFADLSEEDDFAGSTPAVRAFTAQGLPTGERHDQLTPFTTLVGTGYFFVPSLGALAFMAGD
jgi:putative iron-dependent peroxidase